MKGMHRELGCAAAVVLLWAAPSLADEKKQPGEGQEPPADEAAEREELEEDLAVKLTNPVADLVSVPFQFNWRNGVGVNDDLQLVLNIQPVVPIEVTKNWNVIARFIVPVIAQPVMTPDGSPRSGLGDALLSLFASPANTRNFHWGVGPAVVLPLTSDPMLGAGQWSIGPSAVGLYMKSGLTAGALVNHVWSFAETGDLDRRSVSQTFVQPFVAYTTPNAFTFSVQSETAYTWKADDGEEWTAPINAAVSKLTMFGPFPFSIQAGGGYYVERPTLGPEWQLRLAFTVLLPFLPDEEE